MGLKTKRAKNAHSIRFSFWEVNISTLEPFTDKYLCVFVLYYSESGRCAHNLWQVTLREMWHSMNLNNVAGHLWSKGAFSTRRFLWKLIQTVWEAAVKAAELYKGFNLLMLFFPLPLLTSEFLFCLGHKGFVKFTVFWKIINFFLWKVKLLQHRWQLTKVLENSDVVFLEQFADHSTFVAAQRVRKVAVSIGLVEPAIMVALKSRATMVTAQLSTTNANWQSLQQFLNCNCCHFLISERVCGLSLILCEKYIFSLYRFFTQWCWTI